MIVGVAAAMVGACYEAALTCCGLGVERWRYIFRRKFLFETAKNQVGYVCPASLPPSSRAVLLPP